jgi:hypothetical protein
MDASRALTSSRAIATSITGCGDRPLLLALPLLLPLPMAGIPKVIDCGSSPGTGSARPPAAHAASAAAEVLLGRGRALQAGARRPHRKRRSPRAPQVVLPAAARCCRRLLLPLPAAELLPERLQLPVEALHQAADILMHLGSQPGDRQLQLLERALLAGHGCRAGDTELARARGASNAGDPDWLRDTRRVSRPGSAKPCLAA